MTSTPSSSHPISSNLAFPLTYNYAIVVDRSDVYVPTKRYAAVVSNMQDAKSRAKSKLHEDVNATEKLNKAEKIQYETDLKRRARVRVFVKALSARSWSILNSS